MFGYTPSKPEPEPDPCHYSLDLSEIERDTLLSMLRGSTPTGSAGRRAAMARRLEQAPRHDGKPLPDAALDWANLELEAVRQGVSVADIFFDRARAQDPG